MDFSPLPIRVTALTLALAAAPVVTAQSAALRGGKASALTPGLARDNALLLEQNDSEIRKLTKAGGQS